MRALTWRDVAQRSRLRVGGRFFLAVGIVLLAVLGVTASGAVGLARMKTQINQLVSDNLRTSRETTSLELALDDVDKVALEEVSSIPAQRRAELDQQLDETLIPNVQLTLAQVSGLIGTDRLGPRRVQEISAAFDTYLQLRRDGAYSGAAVPVGSAGSEAVASRTAQLFGQMDAVAESLRDVEVREAGAAGTAAESTYRSTLHVLIGGAVASLVVGLTVVLLLIRNLVPRIRSYSQFAARIAAGDSTEMLQVRGHDELSDLGSALNDMIAVRQQHSSFESARTEFVETLQFTSSEEEAHQLLKRHLERSVQGASAMVFIRNNSGNRLEAATAWSPGQEDRAERLVGAEPRSCVALRLGRTHREGGANQLLECSVCEHGIERSTCEPLQVSGEVIGSVLVSHPEVLAPDQAERVSLAVAQAAPVLANLRNLTLAEFRANNDSLTGLPNKRATDDTFKRMVAQAQRSLRPLSLLMLDLDHFKQVNDRHGHEKGDEVLAATGAALVACLRESDFAGRFGGEEFMILLPDTDVDGALIFAERLRQSIGGIAVPGVERAITASLGVAELLQHGGTSAGLLRESDRALYAAKALGRDRVVVAAVDGAAGSAPGTAPAANRASAG